MKYLILLFVLYQLEAGRWYPMFRNHRCFSVDVRCFVIDVRNTETSISTSTFALTFIYITKKSNYLSSVYILFNTIDANIKTLIKKKWNKTYLYLLFNNTAYSDFNIIITITRVFLFISVLFSITKAEFNKNSFFLLLVLSVKPFNFQSNR